MPHRQLSSVLRHIQRIVGTRGGDELMDRQLLERFAAERDEGAFATLVRRHGPLVMGACRRLLPQAQDAEDVFQATFLVLARKAGSIRWRDSVGNWLYEVACRLARKTKVAIARRRAQETAALTEANAEPRSEADYREMSLVLDEELQRLPGKYRTPLLLCLLEGRTRDQAARQLGWSLRTLDRRLQQGRDLLRRRLTRRGVTLSAGLLAAGLIQNSAGAAVPANILFATINNAAGFAAGVAVAGSGISPQVAVLAETLVTAMATSKLKVGAVLVLVASLLASGGLLAQQVLKENQGAGQPDDPPPSAAPNAVQPQPKGKPQAAIDLYGDPLPPGALVRLGTVRLRNPNSIAAVTFSPQGKIVITATDDGLIHLWDLITGKELRRIAGHEGRLEAIALSPDGKVLASTGHKTIHLWDPITGKELRKIPCPVVTAIPGGISWPTAVPITFSADGAMLASISADHAIHLWEVASGKEKRKFSGSEKGFRCIAFSSDGNTLLAASGDRVVDGAIHVWEIATGKEIRTIPIPGKPNSSSSPFAFSPDGNTLAVEALAEVREKVPGGINVYTHYKVHLWDIPSGQERLQLSGQRDVIWTVAFSPDSKTLATSGMDNVISIWDAGNGKLIHRLQGYPDSSRSDAAFTLAFSPDGKTVAAGGDGGVVQLWDVTTGRELLPSGEAHHSRISRVCFSPDGRTLASASSDHTVRLWEAATGKQLLKFEGHDDEVRSLVFSSDGKKLASSGRNSTLHIWEIDTGKELHKIQAVERSAGVYFGICPIAFSPDGKTLISYGDDRKIRLWDVSTGKELGSHHLNLSGLQPIPEGRPRELGDDYVNRVHWVEFSPDGTTAAVAAAKSIYLVHAATGQEFGKLEGNVVFSVLAFSPDGKTIVSEGPNKTLQLWELASGKEIRKIPCPSYVSSVAFSLDGRTLVARIGQNPGMIYFWDVGTGNEFLKIPDHGVSQNTLAFSPDGSVLASAQGNTTILLWDAASASRRNKSPAPDLESKDLNRLWTDLANEDASKAHRALWILVASSHTILPFLRDHLKPIAKIKPDRLQRLIANLDSQSFAEREAASKALTDLGVEAHPALRGAMKGQLSFEARRRMEAILNAPPARMVRSSEALRRVRAIQALEQIGSLEARKILEDLAQGAPGASETQDARQALDYLAKRARESTQP